MEGFISFDGLFQLSILNGILFSVQIFKKPITGYNLTNTKIFKIQLKYKNEYRHILYKIKKMKRLSNILIITTLIQFSFSMIQMVTHRCFYAHSTIVIMDILSLIIFIILSKEINKFIKMDKEFNKKLESKYKDFIKIKGDKKK